MKAKEYIETLHKTRYFQASKEFVKMKPMYMYLPLKDTKEFLLAVALLFSLLAHNHKLQVFRKEHFLID